MSKFNIKKLVFCLVIIMVASFTIGLFLLGLSGFDFENGSCYALSRMYNQKIDEKKIASLEGIREILITTQSTDIKIIPTNESRLTAQLHGSFSSLQKDYRPMVTAIAEGPELKIQILNNDGFFRGSLKLDIYLPEQYTYGLGIVSASGDIIYNSVTELDNITLSTSSGDITGKSITVKKGTVESSSGDIHIHGSFEDIDCRTSSGDIVGEIVKSQKTKLKTTSGNIICKGEPGNADFHSTSGDLNLEYLTFKNSLTAGCTSGNINLKLPQDAQFNFNFHTTSGDIMVSKAFLLTRKGIDDNKHLQGSVGTENNHIVLETTSGDIRISD